MSSHVETCTMLYKVLTDEEFKALPLPPTLWRGTPFDLSTTPPIVHCAASIQVQATLDEVFADATSLWLLAIPKTPRIKAMLRFDGPGEGCAHLHLGGEGIDAWSEVAVRRPITKGAAGTWDVGDLAW